MFTYNSTQGITKV